MTFIISHLNEEAWPHRRIHHSDFVRRISLEAERRRGAISRGHSGEWVKTASTRIASWPEGPVSYLRDQHVKLRDSRLRRKRASSHLDMLLSPHLFPSQEAFTLTSATCSRMEHVLSRTYNTVKYNDLNYGLSAGSRDSIHIWVHRRDDTSNVSATS